MNIGVIFQDPVFQAFLAAMALILLDWLCGILVGIKTGTFKASLLWQQLWTAWFPMAGGLIVLAIVATACEHYPGFIQGTGYVTMIGSIVAVGAKAAIDIFSKLSALLSPPPQPAPNPAPPVA